MSPEEIKAIALALKYKDDLMVLGSAGKVKLKEYLSVGALWAVYELTEGLGSGRALGNTDSGKPALRQVTA